MTAPRSIPSPISRVVRIGTRGSELALAQATLFENALHAACPGIATERVIIRTTGDQRPDIRLAELSGHQGSPVDKGVFTKELEIALQAGDIDIAVHSLKDVPTELEPPFLLAGAMERAPVEDVLLSLHPCPDGLASLPRGAAVATSSVRRKCLLLAARPDLQVPEIRGNVPTRMRKLLSGGHGDALILARAGLERLGWLPGAGTLEIDGGKLHACVLSESRMPPAAGQGAIGLEIRAGDETARALVAAVTHASTWSRVRCERHFLHLLQAGCHTPVGISTRTDNAGRLSARAVVFGDFPPTDISGPMVPPPCRRAWARGRASRPEAVATALFNALA